MAKLTVVFEQEGLVIGRDKEGQLFLAGQPVDGVRQFIKIRSYSLKFNGEQSLDSYVLEDGSIVGPIIESSLPAQT